MLPPERITWLAAPDMPDLEILRVENNRRLWTVLHQTYTVCAVLRHEGITEWLYRGRRHSSAGGPQLTMMEPGEVHQNLRHTGASDFCVFQIKPGWMERLLRELDLTPLHFAAAQYAAPGIVSPFAALCDAIRGQAPRLQRESELVRCVRLLVSRCGERSVPATGHEALRGLRRARDYLHAAYREEVPLAELAGIAGMSRFHFLRSFTRRYGLPPHRYQVCLRVDQARDELKAGKHPGEIDVGFFDQSHLHRHFVRIMGVSLGAYRRMVGPKTL